MMPVLWRTSRSRRNRLGVFPMSRDQVCAPPALLDLIASGEVLASPAIFRNHTLNAIAKGALAFSVEAVSATDWLVTGAASPGSECVDDGHVLLQSGQSYRLFLSPVPLSERALDRLRTNLDECLWSTSVDHPRELQGQNATLLVRDVFQWALDHPIHSSVTEDIMAMSLAENGVIITMERIYAAVSQYATHDKDPIYQEYAKALDEMLDRVFEHWRAYHLSDPPVCIPHSSQEAQQRRRDHLDHLDELFTRQR